MPNDTKMPKLVENGQINNTDAAAKDKQAQRVFNCPNMSAFNPSMILPNPDAPLIKPTTSAP